MSIPELTQSELQRLLSYDPATGVFLWRVSRSRTKKGSIAGSPLYCKGKHYIRIKIFGKGHQAHRLAFFYVTGVWPQNEIDHEDGDGTNNCWHNLRETTRLENSKNMRLAANNTSGCTGVYWSQDKKKYRAEIKVKQKTHYLGAYVDFFEAVCSRKSAEVKYNFHSNHGSPRPRY